MGVLGWKPEMVRAHLEAELSSLGHELSFSARVSVLFPGPLAQRLSEAEKIS